MFLELEAENAGSGAGSFFFFDWNSMEGKKYSGCDVTSHGSLDITR